MGNFSSAEAVAENRASPESASITDTDTDSSYQEIMHTSSANSGMDARSKTHGSNTSIPGEDFAGEGRAGESVTIIIFLALGPQLLFLKIYLALIILINSCIFNI